MFTTSMAKIPDDLAPTEFYGVSYRVLYHNQKTGALSVLVRLAAGSSIPAHWHSTADETVYVIDGDLTENGTAFGPGAFFSAAPQQVHGPHQTAAGCSLLCNYSGGFDFYLSDEVGERRRLRLLAMESSSLASWLIPLARKALTFWTLETEKNRLEIRPAQMILDGAAQKLHLTLYKPGDIVIGEMEKRRLNEFQDAIHRLARLEIRSSDAPERKQQLEEYFWTEGEKQLRLLNEFADRV